MPTINKKQLKKGGKGEVKYAVCFGLNKKCLEDGTTIFSKRKYAKTYIKEIHFKDGGFIEDHHIVKVLITPITRK